MSKKAFKIIRGYGVALLVYMMFGVLAILISLKNPSLMPYFNVVTIAFTIGTTYLLIYVKEYVIKEKWRGIPLWNKIVWWLIFLLNLTIAVVMFFRLFI